MLLRFFMDFPVSVGAFVIGLSQISSFFSNFFVALFVLSLCPFGISVGVGAFVIGLSQISSFFSYDYVFVFKCRF